ACIRSRARCRRSPLCRPSVPPFAGKYREHLPPPSCRGGSKYLFSGVEYTRIVASPGHNSMKREPIKAGTLANAIGETIGGVVLGLAGTATQFNSLSDAIGTGVSEFSGFHST